MKKLFSIFALMLAFAGMANAQWTSPGNGTTYNLDDLVSVSNGSVVYIGELPYSQERPVYRFMADITISPNDQLFIPSHNFIEFDDVTLTIQGSMTVDDSNSDPGNFFDKNHENEDVHPRIRFEDATGASLFKSCVFLTFSGIQIINSEVTFNNCHLYYFDTFHQSSAVNFMNCDPVFTNCLFYQNEGAAISSATNASGSPQILNCVIEYNVTSNTNQPQITLGPGAADTIRIVNCAIKGGGHDMSGGISIADLMNTGETKILLKDNIVKDNRYGYNQQGYNLSSLIIGNQFIDNNFETNPNNGGSGISIYGMNENNKAKLRNNLISGNLWGVTTIYFHDVDMGTENDWGRNVLFGNGNGGNEYAIYNNGNPDVYAIGNYWGYNEEEQIENVIWHSGGDVIWRPYQTLHPDVLNVVAPQEENQLFTRDYYGDIDAENHTIKLHIPEEEITSYIIYGELHYQITISIELPLGNTCDVLYPDETVINMQEPFTFTVTTPHGETQEWTILPESNWGIEESENADIQVLYSKEQGQIEVQCTLQQASVVVSNLMGQVVYTGRLDAGQQSIGVGTWAKGLYVVSLTKGNRSLSQKIIVD